MKPGDLIGLALLGRSSMPQGFDLPLQSPQTEVAVWLHGVGIPRDVTTFHSFACPSPATICIAFPEGSPQPRSAFTQVELRFVERVGSQHLLGTMQLEEQAIVRDAGPQLRLYRVIACRNHCVGSFRAALRSLYVRLARLRPAQSMKISALDSRCNEVVFACPRPVALLSLRLAHADNVVPLNLMAALGNDCFVMALTTRNATAASVTAEARLAVSTVPFESAGQIRRLGGNHRRTSIPLAELPFTLHPSRTLAVAVPDFALTVTELTLEHCLPLGSHTFFITRVIDQQFRGEAVEFHRQHGTCAAYRKSAEASR